MSDWATGSGGGYDSDARVAASSTLITISDGGSDNTLGSYVEFIASTSVQGDGIFLQIGGIYTNNGSWLFDIAIGAAGSEEVIVPQINWQSKSTIETNMTAYLPIRIPKGSRVAIRGQQNGSQPATLQLAITIMSYGHGGPKGFGSADAMGIISSGLSTGTSCDPGGTTANTKVNTEIIASTAKNYKALLVLANLGVNVGISPNNKALFDVCVGASGSEEVIIPDICHHVTGTEAALGVIHGAFYIDVAEGERLSISIQCDELTAADRVRYISLIGFY